MYSLWETKNNELLGSFYPLFLVSHKEYIGRQVCQEIKARKGSQCGQALTRCVFHYVYSRLIFTYVPSIEPQFLGKCMPLGVNPLFLMEPVNFS